MLETAEAPGNAQVGIGASSPEKGSQIDHPNEVHLHICTQHGQQTGETGTHYVAGKLT